MKVMRIRQEGVLETYGENVKVIWKFSKVILYGTAVGLQDSLLEICGYKFKARTVNTTVLFFPALLHRIQLSYTHVTLFLFQVIYYQSNPQQSPKPWFLGLLHMVSRTLSVLLQMCQYPSLKQYAKKRTPLSRYDQCRKLWTIIFTILDTITYVYYIH